MKNLYDYLKILIGCVVIFSAMTASSNIVNDLMHKPKIKVVHYVCVKYPQLPDAECRKADEDDLEDAVSK